MFKCRLVLRMANGVASDVVDQEFELHAVPRVGDRLYIADSTAFEVLEVVHRVALSSDRHEIIVYYGQPRPQQ